MLSNKHEPHPDCPDDLACLPDTDGRPQHTLPVILRCAILGSTRKRLTIREIYAAMEDKYPYYRTAGQTWKVFRHLFIVSFATLIFDDLAIGPASSLSESLIRTPTSASDRTWFWFLLDRKSHSTAWNKAATETGTFKYS